MILARIRNLICLYKGTTSNNRAQLTHTYMIHVECR